MNLKDRKLQEAKTKLKVIEEKLKIWILLIHRIKKKNNRL